MAFNVKSPEADDLLRRLTEVTGESLTEAVIVSLRQRLAREERLRFAAGGRTLDDAVRNLASLSVIDRRSEDEILGYDNHGIPA